MVPKNTRARPYPLPDLADRVLLEGADALASLSGHLLSGLHWFLSFVVSKRVGVGLPVGLDGSGSPVCATWGSPVVDSGVSRIGWWSELLSADLAALFTAFHRHWKDRYWRGVISQVIDSYTFAIRGEHRGDLVISQAALETLAWAVLVIREKRLSGARFRKLPSSARVRRLLEWAGVPTAVPPSQGDLAALARSLEEHRDGPQAVAWVRNKIVHPRPSPEEDAPLPNATLQAHRVALRYLELALLRLFDHHGHHVNWPEGLASGRTLNECIEPVPWANQAV